MLKDLRRLGQRLLQADTCLQSLPPFPGDEGIGRLFSLGNIMHSTAITLFILPSLLLVCAMLAGRLAPDLDN